MRLGIQMLDPGSSINNLMYLNQYRINPGETAAVYFQFVDLDKQNNGGCSGGFSGTGSGSCPPQRYIPATGATVSISLTSININNNITKIPVNAFVGDNSIWSFNMSAADTQIAAGINMKVVLTQGPNINIVNADGVIIIGPQSCYQC